MFLKNFDNLMLNQALGPQRGTYTGTATEAEYLDDTSTLSRAISGSYYPVINIATGIFGLWSQGNAIKLETLPSGQSSSPAATYYDWWPQNIIANNKYTSGGTTRTITTENGTKYINYSFTITNKTEELVISGVWMIANCAAQSVSSSSTSYVDVAFYHKVFDAPVTVPANAVYTMNIKIPITNFRPNKPSA